MPYITQQKSEVILACAPEGISIAELFCDVRCGMFFGEFHLLLQKMG